MTQVICNLVIATASDTCTATVGDAALSGKTNPTGTVKFVSTNGGVFSAGNTCNLVPTAFSGSTSNCSVQFLPPTNPSSFPAITASYPGDAHHNPSSGRTTYGPASELTGAVEVSTEDTDSSSEDEVEAPIACGFPCGVSGELNSVPSPSGEIASVARAKKHGKKKKTAKSLLLGKGSLTLVKPGKGTLRIKLSAKAKRALKKTKHKTVKAILTVTITTPNGTVVATETKHVTIRPHAKKPRKKSKHGKHH